jgi:hypothetical protein
MAFLDGDSQAEITVVPASEQTTGINAYELVKTTLGGLKELKDRGYDGLGTGMHSVDTAMKTVITFLEAFDIQKMREI